uniref:Uncharacterized protein n=1 Tax=Oryza meridionalis TaxID=40149 RepID=A0A0E0CUN3_9ORYZ
MEHFRAGYDSTKDIRSTTIRATLDDGRGGDGDPLQSEKDAAAACGEGGKRQRRVGQDACSSSSSSKQAARCAIRLAMAQAGE